MSKNNIVKKFLCVYLDLLLPLKPGLFLAEGWRGPRGGAANSKEIVRNSILWIPIYNYSYQNLYRVSI
jgi:hypothetical protein